MKRALLFLFLLALCFAGPIGGAAAAYEQAVTQAETSFSSRGAVGPMCSESELGDLVADAMREAAGADFALLPSHYLADTLEAGSVFESDLARVLPHDAALYTAVVSLADLRDLLELSVSRIRTDSAEHILPDVSSWDGYLQVSGFAWEYDVAAPSENRVTRFLLRGEELDMTNPDAAFTLVSTEDLFDGSLGYTAMETERTGETLRSSALSYCSARDALAKSPARTTVIGTSDYPLIDRLPVVAIAAACILVVLFASIPRLKEKARFSFEPTLRSYKQPKDRRGP